VIDVNKQSRRALSIAPGEEPSGIALDLHINRLFSGCHKQNDGDADTESGKVRRHDSIGAGVDGCAFDDARQLAFSLLWGRNDDNRREKKTPDKLTLLQTLKTERGARTMALDPKSHRIYLPSAQFSTATIAVTRHVPKSA